LSQRTHQQVAAVDGVPLAGVAQLEAQIPLRELSAEKPELRVVKPFKLTDTLSLGLVDQAEPMEPSDEDIITVF
jgi:hypothetical protein